MKPRQFEYFAPNSVDEAVSLLAQHGDGARLLAGGQSLLPMMNFRLVSPEVLIDLNRVDDLAYIRAESDAVRIGAMTRQRTLEFSSQMPVVDRKRDLIGEELQELGLPRAVWAGGFCAACLAGAASD